MVIMKKEKKKIPILPVAVATGIGALASQWLFLLALPIALIIVIAMIANKANRY